jgi:hypothetical protein
VVVSDPGGQAELVLEGRRSPLRVLDEDPAEPLRSLVVAALIGANVLVGWSRNISTANGPAAGMTNEAAVVV